MRNKQGEVIAASSGSKLNRKLLTKKRTRTAFQRYKLKQIIQRQEQKQTTAITVRNNTQTAKQTDSTAINSVKSRQSLTFQLYQVNQTRLTSLLTLKPDRDSYTNSKNGWLWSAWSETKSEQNEDSFGKMLLDDLKEAARKERLRLEQPTTFKASLLPKKRRNIDFQSVHKILKTRVLSLMLKFQKQWFYWLKTS